MDKEGIAMAAWLTAIGTFVLALVAVFQDKIRSFLWSPSLDCEITLAPPDSHRTITRSPQIEFYSFYYRFKIWNRGNVSARNVEVLIVDILKREGESFRRIESFSPDNLRWSTLFDLADVRLVPSRYCAYISPDTYKHCNLGHIHDPQFRSSVAGEDNSSLPVGKSEAILCLDVHFRSNILYYLIVPGEYRIQIKVGCENARTIDKWYLLKLSGKWFQDEQRMLNEGLSIEGIQRDR